MYLHFVQEITYQYNQPEPVCEWISLKISKLEHIRAIKINGGRHAARGGIFRKRKHKIIKVTAGRDMFCLCNGRRSLVWGKEGRPIEQVKVTSFTPSGER